MAHAISTKRSNVARLHPDASRIAGLAIAITFNAALLLLLLVPMQTPPMLSLPNIIEPIRWVMPKVDPPTPPIQVPVTPPQVPAPTTPSVIQPPTVSTTVVEQVVVDQGTLQAETVDMPAAESSSTTASNPGPLHGMRLEYANAPAPAYPRRALRARLEGTVLLQVLVDIDGRPLAVTVHQSSGHHALDDAARSHVLQRWTFRPAMRDGRPVQAIGLVPIAFSLDR